MDIDQHLREVVGGLKDFQKATVNNIIKQFYDEGKSRILIADEVGLGKTIVARGVVAKMYERHLKEKGRDQQFDIVYICSNQTIARQNLDKLNIFSGLSDAGKVDYSDTDDRITALAYAPAKIKSKYKFRIKAFTPTTSFDQKTNSGKADERILLYRLLFKHGNFKGKTNSLKWLLKGSRRMKDENWNKLIEDAERFENKKRQKYFYHGEFRKLRWGIKERFYKELSEKVPKRTLPGVYDALGIDSEKSALYLLSKICDLNIRKNNYAKEKHKRFFPFISYLRGALANSCKDYLNADLFILDEFQRFSNIITSKESDNPGIELAKQVMDKTDTKILLLSATPFKPYTNDFDHLQGEYHYREFENVLEFLMAGKTNKDWETYIKNSRAFFNYMRHPEKLKNEYNEAEKVKNTLEQLYRKYMSRTERMIVSKDKDAMIRAHVKFLNIHEEDIFDFVQFDKVVDYLNKKHNTKLSAPIEYIKSSPYPLSFLFDYQHKKKLELYYKTNDELRRLVNKLRSAWINLNNVQKYKPLKRKNKEVMPNAKIRLLIDETVKKKGWKYLWIPPAVPYFELSGPYTHAEHYTKTLIFSSWKMVPRMISTILSYETERYSVGSYLRKTNDSSINYFKKKRSPKPLLLFKTKGDNLIGMNNFLLNYPSVYLSSLYDPEKNVYEQKSIGEVKRELKKKITNRLMELGIFSIGNDNGDWQKWSWYAVLLLDTHHEHKEHLMAWLNSALENKTDISIDEDTQSKKEAEEEKKGKQLHLMQIYDVIVKGVLPNVNKITETQFDKLTDFLVDLTLGAPSVNILRALNKVFPERKNNNSLIQHSYYIASGFISLFNKPESIAIIQLAYSGMKHAGKDYYNKVLQYCIDGNLQAMLDEYFYLLFDSKSVSDEKKLAEMVGSILSIRPSPLDVGSISGMKSSEKSKSKTRIRTHYALDFGVQKISTASAKRQINIREAFNSPFRPFVLASTSIGQEGLDFHFYCKRIFHWNLPSNPIDFEQREGRIHRYKGHVIRLNVAENYKNSINTDDSKSHLWDKLFELAEREKVNNSSACCDLIPYWHLEHNKSIKIDRFIPLYPYSKDIERFHQMQKVLAYYRLTLGQPRQDELIELIDDNNYGILNDLMINLAPILFQKGSEEE